MRAQLQAVRVRLPARRAQGRAGAGHHDRRGPGVLQEQPPALPDPRRARAHRVPQEHDHRRGPRRGRAPRDRRRRGRAGELPPPRVHGLVARHQAARRGREQDGPGRLGPRGVRPHRQGVRRVPRSGGHPPRRLHPGLRSRRRQHRRPLPALVLVQRPDGARRAGPVPHRAGAGAAPVPYAGAGRLQVHQAGRRPPHRLGHDRLGRRAGGRQRDLLSLGQEEPRQEHRGLQPADPAPGRSRLVGRLHARRADLHHARRDRDARVRAAAAGHHPAPCQPVLARQGPDDQAQGVHAQARHGPGDGPDRGSAARHGRVHARYRRTADHRAASRRGRVHPQAGPRDRVRPRDRRAGDQPVRDRRRLRDPGRRHRARGAVGPPGRRPRPRAAPQLQVGAQQSSSPSTGPRSTTRRPR